jgi:small subunit ribosomal protein S20
MLYLSFQIQLQGDIEMANKPAAKKSMRQDKKRRIRNVSIKSELKTLIKKLNDLIVSQKPEDASKMLSDVMSKLDKAAKKGVIKKHNADRKKSYFSSKLAKTKK